MQFMLMVLNKTEVLDTLLEELMKRGICGATILNSTGMMREIAKNSEDFPIFGMLRSLVNLERKESKTIFMVLSDDKVAEAKEVVYQVVGDLSQPDSAVLFTLPVLSAEGVDM